MSGMLLIGPNEKVKISEAITRASANVVPWDFIKKYKLPTAAEQTSILMLKDRPHGLERPASQHIMLGTYRAAISFEEQPAGIMRHLSVSSMNKGKVPGPEVMEMVCEEFGFSKELCQIVGRRSLKIPERPWRLWLEEFAPDHMAVNVIEVEP